MIKTFKIGSNDIIVNLKNFRYDEKELENYLNEINWITNFKEKEILFYSGHSKKFYYDLVLTEQKKNMFKFSVI